MIPSLLQFRLEIIMPFLTSSYNKLFSHKLFSLDPSSLLKRGEMTLCIYRF